jgi:hypothetical protein
VVVIVNYNGVMGLANNVQSATAQHPMTTIIIGHGGREGGQATIRIDEHPSSRISKAFAGAFFWFRES